MPMPVILLPIVILPFPLSEAKVDTEGDDVMAALSGIVPLATPIKFQNIFGTI